MKRKVKKESPKVEKNSKSPSSQLNPRNQTTKSNFNSPNSKRNKLDENNNNIKGTSLSSEAQPKNDMTYSNKYQSSMKPNTLRSEQILKNKKRELKGFSLRHFLYQEFLQEFNLLRKTFNSSYLNIFIVLASFVPHVICFLLAIHFYFSKDIWVVVLFLGLIGNKIMNVIFKNIFRQPRPYTALSYGKTGFGMPSDHSQFMIFFATYACTWTAERISITIAILLTLFNIVVSLIVGLARIHLGLHTIKQTLVGSFVGFIFALIWFYWDIDIALYLIKNYPGYFKLFQPI